MLGELKPKGPKGESKGPQGTFTNEGGVGPRARFGEFHDLSRRVSNFWDHICETESKVGSSMVSDFTDAARNMQNFLTCPQKSRLLGPDSKNRGFFRLVPRRALKSETTFGNQLSILFHRCGLRYFGRASEYHAKNPTTPPSHKVTFLP